MKSSKKKNPKFPFAFIFIAGLLLTLIVVDVYWAVKSNKSGKAAAENQERNRVTALYSLECDKCSPV